jgi:hypothetical protein
MEPLHDKLQVGFVEVMLTDSVEGCTKITVAVAGHPFASVTETVYPPAHKPVIEGVVPPVLHK